MKHSQFWKNLDEVFGSAYGRSLASDLVLEPWYKCAQEAIGSGVEPQQVWEALIDATARPAELKWLHMSDRKKK